MKSDSQLQQNVMDELKWEPGVNHEEIGISAKDGVVTLSGIVDSYSEKLLAEKTARRVKGVRALAEDITVRQSYRSKTTDSEIAKRVADVLEWDSLVPHDEINVTVEDGAVRLRGDVEWNYQKDLAFKDASKITGVLRVDNWINVKPSVSTGDVKQRIEQAFERQADLEAEKIRVRADGHKITLEGTVTTWGKRGIAERAAWAAPGVSQIEDKLTVA
jgi:osmotically-inducible protein OsmY